MASLVDQIFMQAQLGTTSNPNANPFADGMRIGLQKRSLDMQERELAAELKLMPLRETLLQQDAKKREYEVLNLLTQRDNFLKGQEAFTKLNKDVEMALSEATPLDALQIYTREGLRNKDLFFSPAYQELGQQLKTLNVVADRTAYHEVLGQASLIRSEAQKNAADLAASRIELAKTNAELRAKELNQRIEVAKQRMPANRRALMEAKLKAVSGDDTLVGNRDEKLKLLEEIAKEFEQPDVSPGASLAPASTNAFKDAGNGFKFRVTKP
jgi:hypothetical protein